MGLRDKLMDPKSPDRRPRRAAYALPTLFTAGNIFLGFLSILASFRGAMLAAAGGAGAAEQFGVAAKAIGAAVVLDGLDGRIARMTNTTSDFGREMDSLADVVSFGMAPAVLAFSWGVQFLGPGLSDNVRSQIFNTGYFISFLFLLCGAARLARSTLSVMLWSCIIGAPPLLLTAIVMRLDGSMAALLQEVRVVHQQIGRMNDRVRKLEGAEP